MFAVSFQTTQLSRKLRLLESLLILLLLKLHLMPLLFVVVFVVVIVNINLSKTLYQLTCMLLLCCVDESRRTWYSNCVALSIVNVYQNEIKRVQLHES